MEIQERTIYSKRFRTIEDDIRDIYREMGEDPRIKPAETEAAPVRPPNTSASSATSLSHSIRKAIRKSSSPSIRDI